MTNSQHKFQMKSKVKVKPYCFMEGKKKSIYKLSRAEFKVCHKAMIQAHSLELQTEATGCLCSVLSSSIRTHMPHGKLCLCLHFKGSNLL